MPERAQSPNRMSHWFPAVVKVCPPSLYPATTLVKVECDYAVQLCEPDPDDEHLLPAAVEKIERAIAAGSGYPCFLRSDLMSGKHCYPESRGIIHGPEDIAPAVVGIAENAEIGLWMEGDTGCDVWAVRELLSPVYAPRSMHGLPIGAEWRLIVRNGRVTEESGFYWPAEAMVKNDGWPVEVAEAYIAHLMVTGYPSTVEAYSVDVAAHLGGDWSVDWMHAMSGWKLIDMAEADRSWIPNPRPVSIAAEDKS